MAMKSSLFTNASDVENYKAGDVIFAKGSEGKVAYALVSGEVELISGERILETLVAGAIFGEMALIDHLPRSRTTTALRELSPSSCSACIVASGCCITHRMHHAQVGNDALTRARARFGESNSTE